VKGAKGNRPKKSISRKKHKRYFESKKGMTDETERAEEGENKSKSDRMREKVNLGGPGGEKKK